MLSLPDAPETSNVHALAMWRRERFTGLTTTALTLSSFPRRNTNDEGLELLFKNGTLLDPSGGAAGYSISGKDVTLGTAAIAGDVFLAFYPFRET